MVVVGALAALTSVVACSRTSSSDTGTKTVAFPKAKAARAASPWQITCDKLCDVHAKGKTLESLCANASAAAKPVLGDAACTTRHVPGLPAIAASAVTDAALVELTPNGKVDRTGFLALKTSTGWQLARPLGAGATLALGPAAAVDVPGLAPAGVQLQVAVSGASGKSERLFVCGLTGEGAVHCPVALETSSSPSGLDQVAAYARGSAAGAAWKATVEITPTGYIATRVAGALPDGLAGQHGWDALPR